MTYVSFWLEAAKKGDPKEKPAAHTLPDPPSGRFGPYALRDWATRENLKIDYVDNCWLRVRVQRANLVELFEELYGQEAEIPLAIVAAVSLDCEFTLVAEEF